MPCPGPGPAVPCPVLPCPALPCPGPGPGPGPAVPCPALPCPGPALPCPPLPFQELITWSGPKLSGHYCTKFATVLTLACSSVTEEECHRDCYLFLVHEGNIKASGPCVVLPYVSCPR